jgi:nitrile hydratase accessory protein
MINPMNIAHAQNGPQAEDEPVFLTPWEARIFAIVAHLAENATLDWEDFRANLIARIAKDERLDASSDMIEGTPYYRSWLAAAEALLDSTAYCTGAELEARIHTLSHHDAPGKLSVSGPTPRPVAEG